MNQELINAVMYDMNQHLDNEQLLLLKLSLEKATSEDGVPTESLQELLECFILTKQLEGRSERTLKYYRMTVEKMFNTIDKSVKVITTDD